MEMKFQLMEGIIAHEFSVRWDSTSLRRKLRSSNTHAQDQLSDYGPANGINGEDDRSIVSSSGTHEFSDGVVGQGIRNDLKGPNSIVSDVEENTDHRKPFTSRTVPAPYVRPEVDRCRNNVQDETAQNSSHVDKKQVKNINNDSVDENKPKSESIIEDRMAQTLASQHQDQPSESNQVDSNHVDKKQVMNITDGLVDEDEPKSEEILKKNNMLGCCKCF